jgi:selenocysteine lyase/cysteine desulfurase
MSGAQPIYMPPEVDLELRMDHCVTPETVARTIEQHPDLVAVYLVSPTYYGVAADLEAIERIVHEAGKVLLVDEAWGPHFHFHPALPLSATNAGADICINSTHKMLSAFSQCAMLHHKGERVALDRLEAGGRDARAPEPDSGPLLFRRRAAGPPRHLRSRPDKGHGDGQRPGLYRLRGLGAAAPPL